MLTIDEQLDQALSRVTALEADAQARETLLSEAATKTELLQGQLVEATANRERLESDLATARQSLESLNTTKTELDAKVAALSARNAELEAREQDIEARSSKRAAEIVAATGTASPVSVTPKGDQQGEDLIARFKAINDPKEQTAFWRSLSAQQQAVILSSTSNQ